MKKLLCALLLAALLIVPVAGLVGSALVDDDAVLSNLLPTKNTDSKYLTATGCEISYGSNGEVIVTLTAASAKITYTMTEGNNLIAGSKIDLSKPAFCAVDYGSADGVTVKSMCFHYTRKDKTDGAVADLFLWSMADDENYASSRKQGKKDDKGEYVVWDWGTYVSSSDSKLFADKQHNFTSTEIELEGTVGSKITFYTAEIVNDANVKGLGDDRPEPTKVETSSEVESSVETSAATSATISDESEEVSNTSSEASSKEESSVAATSSAATSASTSSAASTASESTEEGGLSTGAIVGIVCAVVAVIVVVAVVVVVMKKKKG